MDADPVTGADALVLHPRGGDLDLPPDLAVGEDARAVVEARGVRVPFDRRPQHVEECPWGRSVRAAQILLWDGGHVRMVSL